jgi:hypothetical protein
MNSNFIYTQSLKYLNSPIIYQFEGEIIRVAKKWIKKPISIWMGSSNKHLKYRRFPNDKSIK